MGGPPKLAKTKKRSSIAMMAKAAARRMSLFGMNGVRTKSFKKVLPSTEAAFMSGKNLTERLWLPGMVANTIDVNADQLQQSLRSVSQTLGTKCHLLCAHMLNAKGKTTHVRRL